MTVADGKDVRLPLSDTFLSRETVIDDYRLAFRSREASLVGRREVTAGRAKFGIFGDGKEIAQVALAHVFQAGDWRAGYYRDQTLMLATGMGTLRTFFGLLYATPNEREEPGSRGRQMANHFGTRFLDQQGQYVRSLDQPNSSADMSPLASWLPRALGLAYASKLYRIDPVLATVGSNFSSSGNEVAFATIGDASTSEGQFWEVMNAASVLQVPLLVSVWDDGYGISVPTSQQTTGGSISHALEGFAGPPEWSGLTVQAVSGWDYVALCDGYRLVCQSVREKHQPALVHVTELTQPLGHSTSGSHERYKPTERLQWEAEHDCLPRMASWLMTSDLATEAEIGEWADEDRSTVEAERAAAWNARMDPIRQERDEVVRLLQAAARETGSADVEAHAERLGSTLDPDRRSIDRAAARAVWALRGRSEGTVVRLRSAASDYHTTNTELYTSHLTSQSSESPLRIGEEAPVYAETPELVDGRLVLRRCFDDNLTRDSRIVIWGEDVGVLGDVNLVFEGLQTRYGRYRVTDTSIREASIVGQAIGAAMRGLRPLADIQYLDYLLCALQVASDDLACLHWRTAGGQKAPVVIRTKGHRFQGIWHAGSPLGMLINALRGIHIAVPRDCTHAAGLYNTLLRGDDPGLVIEVLNGYRRKEPMPDNAGSMRILLGRPEYLRRGRDLTLVTYGACCAVAMEAAENLAELQVEVEVMDVQTLLPFDVHHEISASLERTNAVLFLDEDVPGGASAYMMQQVLEVQSCWQYLDAAPRTVTAPPTRTGFAVDGDYYGKPSVEDVVRVAYETVRERNPTGHPAFV